MQIAISTSMEDQFVDAHRHNACCEILTADLYQTIKLARECIVPEAATYYRDSEQHPAIRHLCQWWNDLAPAPESRRAAQIQIFVRAEKSNLYANQFGEITSVDDMWREMSCNACARWGDQVLIEFGQSRSANFYSRQMVQVFNVVGLPFFSVENINLQDAKTHDYAKRGLESLQKFPERFPVVWEKLKAAL